MLIMRFLTILKFPLLLIIATTMLITSCIDEDNSNCVQYALNTQLLDKSGNVLPDSTATDTRAYLFINNKFDHIITAESNGRYLISFDGKAKVSLVAFGDNNKGLLGIYTPNAGDKISSIYAHLSSKAEGKDSSSTNLFYGRFDYTSASSGKINNVVLPMHSQQATVHVVAKHLREYYGSSSNYHIVLSGFHNSVTFDGTVTGDSVTYTPNAAFDSNGNLCSEALYTLPTKIGESVTVSIYKDNSLVWQSAKDYQGNATTLSAGDNKYIIIDVERK